ncbi:MAG: lytic transglycosylase domain-containing protein [Spirochaetales bacterium]|nr:lytic transglycosylase domain-containing protein [Spirochaetales bacterium]
MTPHARIQHIQERIESIVEKFEPRKKESRTAPAQPAIEKKPLNEILYREEKTRTRFSDELEGLISLKSKEHGVHPDLIKAVIKVESNGNPRAVSKAGAIGLMQLMPDTARALGVDPHDPAQNVDGGVRFLKDMARQFGNLDHTLAAYNAGPGAVRRYKGVPPYAETMNYVKKIRTILKEE